MRPARRSRGFTLVELMITVIVLGVLAALAYPAFANVGTQGSVAGARSDLLRLQQAATDAYQESGSYPASTGGWVSSISAPTNFTATSGYQVQVTMDVGGQGAVLQSRTSSGSVSCTMNVGNKSSPGVVSC